MVDCYSCRGFEANPLYIELWIYYRCKRNLILTSLALWIFKIRQTVQKLAKCILANFITVLLSKKLLDCHKFFYKFTFPTKRWNFQATSTKILHRLTWDAVGGLLEGCLVQKDNDFGTFGLKNWCVLRIKFNPQNVSIILLIQDTWTPNNICWGMTS